MTAQTALKKTWTWDDYLAWDTDQRWEIIGGEACAMAPAPSVQHQAVALRIASRLESALKGKSCRPFIAPIDVKLSATDVVQPDIIVVCDPGKITAQHIDGAPDVVIEVLSPGTAVRDLREKKSLYAHYGVREYVVVDPLEQYAVRFTLEAGSYGAGETIDGREVLVFLTLDALAVSLWEVFELPAPGVKTGTAEPNASE
jgi:Uma2 family endonuclease